MRLFFALGVPVLVTGAALSARAGQAPDPVRGERAFQKCYACHALEPARNDLTGPNLHQIVGRPVAAEEDFAYSKAMRDFASREPRWTAALLDRFLADPEALVPGTDMGFMGMESAERADLIAYLSRSKHSEGGAAIGRER